MVAYNVIGRERKDTMIEMKTAAPRPLRRRDDEETTGGHDMVMTRTELLERARAITGRGLLGHVSVSERAYDELGPARCLDLLRRYGDVDGPDADGLSPVPALGSVHQAEYWREGRHYVILTERLHQRCGPHQFWSELSCYDEAWPVRSNLGLCG
jgi:hypothetical protein